jgi:hypothetical protein
MHKITNGIIVELTEEEVADLAAIGSDLAYPNIRYTEILTELAALDRWLPRSVEDLIEAEAIPLQALSIQNQERLVKKQTLRTELLNLNK